MVVGGVQYNNDHNDDNDDNNDDNDDDDNDDGQPLVHLENLTIRHYGGCGVVMGGCSFTMEDVVVEGCGGDGTS